MRRRLLIARALACDPVSAFGGIIAVNRRLDAAAAEKMAGIFSDVIIAPEADPDAVELLSGEGQAITVAENGRPVGIVTRADLLESLAS